MDTQIGIVNGQDKFKFSTASEVKNILFTSDNFESMKKQLNGEKLIEVKVYTI